jgi:hypothetical protein
VPPALYHRPLLDHLQDYARRILYIASAETLDRALCLALPCYSGMYGGPSGHPSESVYWPDIITTYLQDPRINQDSQIP